MLKDLECKTAKGRSKAYKLSDSHGMYLYITPNGSKIWRWNYRFQGKGVTQVLGHYPAVTLAQARLERSELDKIRRSGQDPRRARKQMRLTQEQAVATTFEMVARDWHAQRRRLWTPTHADNILTCFEREIFPHFGHKPITEVRAPDILAALRPIEERGAVDRAHRTRQFVSGVFQFAIACDLAEHDPASKLKGALKPKQIGRQPALRKIEDARALLQASESAPAHPLTKLASRMLAATAVRSGPLRHAEPHEFEGLDSDNPIWRIPASKMKLDVMQKQQEAFEFVVPLAPEAVKIIKLALQFNFGGKYVFPNARFPNKPMSENAISVMYRRLPEFAGRHVPHGWRATFSTIMNERAQELGRPGDRAVIDLMLAHKQVGVEALYNRASYMPHRRQLAEEWGQLLLGHLPCPSSFLEGRRR